MEPALATTPDPAEEFLACWRTGDRRPVESFLRDRPDLAANLDEVGILVGIEIQARLERKESPSLDEYLVRFPKCTDAVRWAFVVAPSAHARGHVPADPRYLDNKLNESDSSYGKSSDHTVVDEPARRIPGYEILTELGRGAMGVVYKARQINLNRTVALKVILAGGHAGREVQTRFVREAEAVAALDHSGVVQVHDFGTVGGLPYIALEYCTGGTLAARLAGSPLPTRDAAILVEKLTRAVATAHERGIFHRDLKPANVLIAGDGTPKVADFGLAKVVGSDDGATGTGAPIGTPPYMAPEQIRDAKSVGPAADIYGLGAVLYECLTGRPPFRGATVADTFDQVLARPPVAPAQLNPAVPRDLEAVCLKCLEKAPHQRYITAALLAEDLGRFLAGRPTVARPRGIIGRAWRWCVRRPYDVALMVAATLLIVMIGIGGWRVQTTRADRDRRTNDLDRVLDEAEEKLDALRKLPPPVAGQTRDRGGVEATLRKAEGLLAGLPAAPERATRLASLQAALDHESLTDVVVADLRRVRLLTVRSVKGHRIPTTRRSEEYALAFMRLGINPVDSEAAADIVSASSAPTELVSALDDWLLATTLTKKVVHQVPLQKLLDLLTRVDQDPLRREIRTALASADAGRLLELARHPEVIGARPETVCLVASSLVSQGRLEDSIALLRRAHANHQTDILINFKLADYLTDLKKPRNDEALPHYMAALSGWPTNSLIATEMSRCYRMLADKSDDRRDEFRDRASRLTDFAIKLDPENVEALCALAELYDSGGKTEIAEQTVRRALQIDPRSTRSYKLLAVLLNDCQKFAEAESEARAGIAISPAISSLWQVLGDALRGQKQYSAAEAACREAVRLNPNESDNWYSLALVLSDSDKNDEAEKAIRESIRLSPGQGCDHDLLGTILCDLGRLDESVTEYQRAIDLEPTEATYYCNLGQTREQQGRLDKAEVAYRKAIEIDPKYAAPHNNLGILLRRNGDLTGAEAAYRKAIEIDPKYATAHNNLGILLEKSGNLTGAEAAFRKAIEIDPKDAAPHNNLGSLLRRNGDLTGAEAAFRKAIEIDPKYAAPHNNLGSLLERSGDLTGAEAAFRKAIEIDPKDATAHSNLGITLQQSGNLTGAEAAFRKAIEINMNNAEYRRMLERVKRWRAALPRLAPVVDGADPADATEALALANLCGQPFQKRYALAVQLYRKAFELDPTRADDLVWAHRYNAACYAARAGCGDGVDARTLTPEQKIAIRAQALAWLQADLALRRRQAENGGKDRTEFFAKLSHWLIDPDFENVRHPFLSLAVLPTAEVREWQVFWREVRGLRDRTVPPSIAPPPRPGRPVGVRPPL
ncbi:hypothetical protein FTUN_2933 [Frigoriglobus tundricola]|uniref:Protein kinase domain-containing protein n=2 Tax=Frigoriglobus tundricola TaxID=2774151 RepID=A0A6M5YPG1_9BACT|nr:hypothetical protein FTUN_2933 [Frigoriglobus tundricola]